MNSTRVDRRPLAELRVVGVQLAVAGSRYPLPPLAIMKVGGTGLLPVVWPDRGDLQPISIHLAHAHLAHSVCTGLKNSQYLSQVFGASASLKPAFSTRSPPKCASVRGLLGRNQVDGCAFS